MYNKRRLFEVPIPKINAPAPDNEMPVAAQVLAIDNNLHVANAANLRIDDEIECNMNRVEPEQEAHFEEVLVEDNNPGSQDPLTCVKQEATAFVLNEQDENELIEIIDDHLMSNELHIGNKNTHMQAGTSKTHNNIQNNDSDDSDDEPIFDIGPNGKLPAPLKANEHQLIKMEDDSLSGNLPFTQKVSI